VTESKPGDLAVIPKTHAADLMGACAVGNRVGNVRNNDPTLLDPVTLAA
jgi:hypothetical protein